MHNEYKFNKKFRDYVDKYCKQNKCSIEESFGSAEVRRAYQQYREV